MLIICFKRYSSIMFKNLFNRWESGLLFRHAKVAFKMPLGKLLHFLLNYHNRVLVNLKKEMTRRLWIQKMKNCCMRLRYIIIFSILGSWNKLIIMIFLVKIFFFLFIIYEFNDFKVFYQVNKTSKNFFKCVLFLNKLFYTSIFQLIINS